MGHDIQDCTQLSKIFWSFFYCVKCFTSQVVMECDISLCRCRAEFAAFHSAEYTEELLALHEAEVQRLATHLANNRNTAHNKNCFSSPDNIE